LISYLPILATGIPSLPLAWPACLLERGGCSDTSAIQKFDRKTMSFGFFVVKMIPQKEIVSGLSTA
jgi:hypothetical protein